MSNVPAMAQSLAASAPNDPDNRPRRRYWVVGVAIAAGAPVLGLSINSTSGSTTFYVLTIILAAIWIVGAYASGPLALGDFGVGKNRTRAGAIILGVAVGAATGIAFLIGGAVARDIPGLGSLIKNVLGLADSSNLYTIAVITAVNGIAEELFFRGAVYQALQRHRPVVLTTVVYVLVTLCSGNPMLGVAAVVLGAICAVLRRATGGVLAPAFTHLVWSLIVYFALPAVVG